MIYDEDGWVLVLKTVPTVAIIKHATSHRSKHVPASNSVLFSILLFDIDDMFSSNHGTRALFQTSLQERSTYQRIWLIPTFRSLNDICKFFAEFSRKLLIFQTDFLRKF